MLYKFKTVYTVCTFPSLCTNVKKCFYHTRLRINNPYTYKILWLSLIGHHRAKIHEASIPIAKQFSGNNLVFSENIDETSKQELTQCMIVYEDFISISEEQSIIDEVEPYMKRLRYEFDHWDDAIHGFRETERANWNLENTRILQRVKEIAFPFGSCHLNHVHVLDLAEDGHIKPHIDSTRFCGNIIAGLSLLSNSVMRMAHESEKDKTIDVLLKRRSLYVMKDVARYHYTHEILGNTQSEFNGNVVKKSRRLSVICRNEPNHCDAK